MLFLSVCVRGQFYVTFKVFAANSYVRERDSMSINYVVTSPSFSIPADQYEWLERDLAFVDREVTPWLVVAWHPPWYSTYKAHYREAECMRVEMEDLLYEYGVDVVFNGHVSILSSKIFIQIPHYGANYRYLVSIKL